MEPSQGPSKHRFVCVGGTALGRNQGGTGGTAQCPGTGKARACSLFSMFVPSPGNLGFDFGMPLPHRHRGWRGGCAPG